MGLQVRAHDSQQSFWSDIRELPTEEGRHIRTTKSIKLCWITTQSINIHEYTQM